MKRTKIICTMGPNTNDKNIMMELAKNGMDVARFNFSHGDYDEHLGRLELLKEVRKELDIPVAALLDTKGPEIRTGLLKDGKKVVLKEGQTYTLTTEETVGDETRGYINYDGLNADVTAGNKILIDDGLIELEVEEVKGPEIVCKVINGGELGEKKGVNVPNVKIKLPALTDKDKEDIRFGIELGFDYIAASFVRSADAIREIREMGDFCIGAACYPEGHVESANKTEDILHLKEKVEAGCDFVTTQMFFDNNILYNYLYRIREKGVTVPVVAGIMPVTSASQIARICRMSGTYLPSRFKAIVDRFGGNPAAMKQAGIAYATEQIIDLIANGVNAIHVYSMNKPDVAARIQSSLSEIL